MRNSSWLAGIDLGGVEFGLELLALIPLIHIVGGYCAYRAIVRTRTAQGAIAWAVSLIVLPYIAVPMYVVFGRRKFRGYVAARRAGDLEINHIAMALAEYEQEFRSTFKDAGAGIRTAEKLAKMPFTEGNAVDLLIDGEAIFNSILAGIDGARTYILVQFYIVHDDELGRELKRRLIARASAGVRIYFIYDEIGCHKLPDIYVESLSDQLSQSPQDRAGRR